MLIDTEDLDSRQHIAKITHKNKEQVTILRMSTFMYPFVDALSSLQTEYDLNQ
jgi:hypothetical protein